MSEIEVHTAIGEGGRAEALVQAVQRLGGGAAALNVRLTGGWRHVASLPRELQPIHSERTLGTWRDLSPTALSRLIEIVYTSTTEVSVDWGIYSLSCRGSGGPPEGRLSLIVSKSVLLGSNPSHVDVPAPGRTSEAVAVHAARWQNSLSALVYGMTSGGLSSGVTTALICDESGWGSPFDSYATAHGSEESLALDFGRGWLCAHAAMPMEELTRLGRGELLARVSSAPDQGCATRLYPAVDTYDGSLTRSEVQRVLALSDAQVFRAYQAVCASSAETRSAFELGNDLIRALASGSAPMTVRLSPKRILTAPQLVRLPNDLWMLHTGPLERLWPVYREVASLLVRSL